VFLCLAGPIQSAPQTAADAPVATGKLITVSTTGQSAWVRFSQASDPQLGDRVVFLRETKLLGEGVIGVRTDSDVAVRITWQSETLKPQDRGLWLPADLAAGYRRALPAGITLAGKLLSVGPGHANGWVDIGSNQGLATGDALMVRRDDIGIAAARVAALGAHRAFVTLHPLVANIRIQLNDPVRLRPAPAFRKAGVTTSHVLHVDQTSSEPLVIISAGGEAGLKVADQIEFRRAGDYVGAGQIERADEHLAQVRMVDAFTKQPPVQGDLAIQRSSTVEDPITLANVPGRSGRIFRIEGKYCLINLGEQNGLERGHRLAVIRGGKKIADLVVKTVKVDYCGADIQGRPGEIISLWDEVFVEPFRLGGVLRVGTVQKVSGSGQCRQIILSKSELAIRPGRMVLLGLSTESASSEPGASAIGAGAPTSRAVQAAALVLAVGHGRAILWNSPSWRTEPIVGKAVWMETGPGNQSSQTDDHR